MTEAPETKGELAGEPDEFAGIEPAPPGRSPVMALVIIGLSAAMLFALRGDLRYALGGRTPTSLEELRGRGEPLNDRYAKVSGVADRRNALYLEARGDKTRETFFRLIDAEPPVFVRARDTTGRTDLDASWTGRLRRFGDTSYAASLREYMKRGAVTTRFVDPVTLRARVATGAGPLRDRVGREITVPDDTILHLGFGMHRYALYMSRDKHPKAEDAERELARLLAEVDPTGQLGKKLAHAEDVPDAFVFTLPIEPGAVMIPRQLAAKLEEREIEFAGYADRLDGPLGKIRVSGEGDAATVAASNKDAPVALWKELQTVSFTEPLTIPDEALVLTEGESPQALLWAPIVAALLLAVALFNVWYLLRPRRAA